MLHSIQIKTAACLLAVFISHAQAAFIAVNRDHDIANDGDGGCNLREAVRAANQNIAIDGCTAGGDNIIDFITLEVAGPINLQGHIEVTGSTFITPHASLSQRPLIFTSLARRLLVVNQSEPGDDVFFLGGVTLQDGFPHTVNMQIEDGGALWVKATGQMEINDVVFRNNRADNGGAIIFTGSNGEVTLSDCLFTDNRAESGGGGVYVINAIDDTLTINDSRFENNQAFNGGAVMILDATQPMHLRHNVFLGNSAGDYGGALFLGQPVGGPGQVYNLHGNALIDNSAVTSGAALQASKSNTLVHISNTTVAKNHHPNPINNGVIDANEADLRIAHSTLYDNGPGAAIHVPGVSNPGSALIYASILFNPDAAQALCSDADDIASAGHNVAGENSCDFLATGDVIADPGLTGYAIGGNGVPGFNLKADSPALDKLGALPCEDAAGNPLNQDQQGTPRPLDGDGNAMAACDAGALEAPANRDLIYVDAFGV